ncbi:MAG TPA: glycosyltransferase family 4 protein [Acidimicrobiia bacterium]|jgi:glycosyltransferase involved in cell wall biosynthesis
MIGGGERYPMWLADEMAHQVPTTLVTFGSKRRSFQRGSLQVEVYPVRRFASGAKWDPVSIRFVGVLRHYDVVHVHQFRTFVSNLSVTSAAFLNKRVFLTDHGGSALHLPDTSLLGKLVDGVLPVSQFSQLELHLDRPTRVIGGGVPDEMLAPLEHRERLGVLFVGRLLPHKGVEYLIKAVEPDVPLVVIGRAYDDVYFERLQQLAAGKSVRFITDAGDDTLADCYRQAVVTVLPSVYTDEDGRTAAAPELLGLALLESMACGTPVICTDVGGMPEFVDDGITGYIVPPNDIEALRERIHRLIADASLARQMGLRARDFVQQNSTWAHVVDRCLDAYEA